MSPAEAYGRLIAELQKQGVDEHALAVITRTAGRLSGELPNDATGDYRQKENDRDHDR